MASEHRATGHLFCRMLLSQTMGDVRKYTKASQRKETWGYKFDFGGDDVEWHGPDGFYWQGSGCCLWAARAKGWDAWLNKNVPEYQQEE